MINFSGMNNPLRKLKKVHENATSQLQKKAKRLTARLLHGMTNDWNDECRVTDDK